MKVTLHLRWVRTAQINIELPDDTSTEDLKLAQDAAIADVNPVWGGWKGKPRIIARYIRRDDLSFVSFQGPLHLMGEVVEPERSA